MRIVATHTAALTTRQHRQLSLMREGADGSFTISAIPWDEDPELGFGGGGSKPPRLPGCGGSSWWEEGFEDGDPANDYMIEDEDPSVDEESTSGFFALVRPWYVIKQIPKPNHE